jgi:hypothetical protein
MAGPEGEAGIVRCLSSADVDLALQANRLGVLASDPVLSASGRGGAPFRLKHDHTRSAAVKLALLTAARVRLH